ncbi:hypothetical protein LSTR_LSTR014703 [Laodelphax striatellus]|uniref:Fatty acyl-CoA reductase C-terminal domain-containing protein n=1 Tax=Laodelphax striatellus TaxID=195883 RepID=A0A482XB04_LAOST|nr:hypothetical protein LSTR_LSTR014703 [Laodelphax striatellus]
MVYNCTTGVSNPIYWRDLERLIKESILLQPCENVIWYPGGSFKGSRFMNNICVAISHLLPAYLMDTCTRIAGRKPIMVTVQNKLLRAAECLEFFTTHEWKFTNTNMLKLYESLPPSDRELFNFDVNDINWQEYMQLYWLGIRRFILKEDLSNDSAARSRLRKSVTPSLIAVSANSTGTLLFLKVSSSLSAADSFVSEVVYQTNVLLARRVSESEPRLLHTPLFPEK